MRRSGFKGLVAAGIVATSLAASTSVVSANDMFLKIDGIKGESRDDKHKDWIDVLSWSWGTAGVTGRLKRGDAPMCIKDLSFTKFVDSSTPGLIMNGVTGQSAKTATLTVRKAGGTQQEYLILKMEDVLVSSYQTGAHASDSQAQLVDAVTLNFSSISGEYRPQSPDGKLGEVVKFDITTDCQQK